jgi:hypothetical protein
MTSVHIKVDKLKDAIEWELISITASYQEWYAAIYLLPRWQSSQC